MHARYLFNHIVSRNCLFKYSYARTTCPYFRGKSVLGVSICPTIGKACSVGQEFSGLEENFFQQESMEAICRCSRQLSLSTKGGDLSPLACCLVPGNYW